jgi:acetyl esterase/lipase
MANERGMPTRATVAAEPVFAGLSIAVVAALMAAGFAMIYPLPFDGTLGFLGATLLFFPLHLLVIAAIFAVLTIFAYARRARFTAALYTAATLLGAAMALWPGLAMWRFAAAENVSLSLGDYLAYAAHLNVGVSQPARTAAYGVTADGTTLLLDVWPTGNASSALHPAIVRIHGGAFVSGSRSAMPDWNRWFNDLGYDVFDIDYRLPPPVRWRDEIGDVKCALGWVAAHAGQYGIDPARISVTGFSAGATLAMLAAYSTGESRLPPSCAAPSVAVRAVINIYGVSDLTRLYDTSPSRALVSEASEQYIGGSPATYPERFAAVSPLTYVGSSSPPTISFLGASDRIIPAEQLALLDEALKRAGATSEAYLLPATDHGFDANWGGFATQFARIRIARFLDRYR